MQRHLIYFVILILSSCQSHSINKKIAAIRHMPSFKILSVDSSRCINSTCIPAGHPVIFMYFDPECEHCQWETKNIINHISELQHVNIYMIANNESSKILQQFSTYFHLEIAQNIFVGRDFEFSFFRAFSAPQVPYLAIYDSHRKLKKIYQGETNIQSIVNAVQD